MALLRDTFQALIITHHEKRRSGKRSIMKKRASIWDSENKTEIDKLTMIFMIYNLLQVPVCYNVCTKSVFDFNSLFFVEWLLWYFSTFCDLKYPPISCSYESMWKTIKKNITGDRKNLASLFDSLNILEDSTFRWH